MTYTLFISYSQARDRAIAAAVQSVTKTLGKRWWQARRIEVFRDETSLSASPKLWPSIENALGQSEHLLLIASPEAARSEWVAKEVETWFRLRGADEGARTLLIALSEGELVWRPSATDFEWSESTPLPPLLKGRFPEPPLWIDLRRFRGVEVNALLADNEFKMRAARIAAYVQGVTPEALFSEESQQQRRQLRLFQALTGGLAVVLAIAGGLYWQWTSAEQRVVRLTATEAQLLQDRAARTDEAIAARQEAEKNAKQAADNAAEAQRQSGIALENERQANENADTARRNEKQAVAERDRAGRTLQSALAFAKTFLRETNTTLADKPGISSTEIERLLGLVRKAVDDLGREAPDDRTVRATRVNLLTSIAETYIRLGPVTEMERVAREAATIADDLLKETPDDAEALLTASLAYEYLGDAFRIQCRSELSEAAYAEMFARVERVPEAVRDAAWLNRMRSAHQWRGTGKSRQGRNRDALRDFKLALEYAERYVAELPRKPDATVRERLEARQSLARIRLNVIEHLDELEATGEASEQLAISQQEWPSIIRDSGGNKRYMWHATNLTWQLGRRAQQAGRLEEAERHFREGLERVEILFRDDPDNLDLNCPGFLGGCLV